MTKTLLLAVTYIGVTVDSLFTSEFPVVEGGVADRKAPPPLPLSVFCLWVISDGRLKPKSYAFFFFLFTSFFFSICTNNESFCYFVSIFFFLFILVLWSILSGEQAKFSLSIKKKNYCQWTSRLHYSSFIITNVYLLRGAILYKQQLFFFFFIHHYSE